jgi:aspartyl-tRNA(Asn)/glutamyl-tRNA(Gln) amidotransferase subunit C
MDWRLEVKSNHGEHGETEPIKFPVFPMVISFFMPITQAEVEKIAGLANLELTAEEKLSLASQLAAIVEYIDQLNELDSSTVKPWQQQGAGEMITSYTTREDIVEPCLGQQKALDQAPDQDDGNFLVPRVIGGQ